MLETLRIEKNIKRAKRVRFTFNETEIEGHLGEPLVAALWVAGVRSLRYAPRDEKPRGLYCAMGNCQECAVMINGMKAEACRVVVNEGMVVTSLRGPR
jgi:predicted molibdopterin-dependent oxidoreductase YjgC